MDSGETPAIENAPPARSAPLKSGQFPLIRLFFGMGVVAVALALFRAEFLWTIAGDFRGAFLLLAGTGATIVILTLLADGNEASSDRESRG